MKKIAHLLILLLALVACKKEKVYPSCETTECQDYLVVWEHLLMTQNGMSKAWLDDHIEVEGTEWRSLGGVDYFSVYYNVHIGWAEVGAYDRFATRISPDVTLYPATTVPRGPYLSEDEIGLLLRAWAFDSKMTRIEPVKDLRFRSKAAALKALEDKVGISLNFDDLRFDRSTYFFQGNGHMFLQAAGQRANADNVCVFGRIDLSSGFSEFNEGPCAIF